MLIGACDPMISAGTGDERGQYCSVTDPDGWCCALAVPHCVCYEFGTYTQLDKICATSKNGGIDCIACPASPRCTEGGERVQAQEAHEARILADRVGDPIPSLRVAA